MRKPVCGEPVRAVVSKLGVWTASALRLPYPHVDVNSANGGRQNPALSGLPLQHASPRILKLMKTSVPLTASWRAIAVARNHPELTQPYAPPCGFPGETEEDFQMLLDATTKKEARLDRVGCFRSTARWKARARMSCRIRCGRGEKNAGTRFYATATANLR